MRTIEYTGPFRRDWKRELKGRYRDVLQREFPALLELLSSDQRLPERFRDHALTGNWIDYRDCHLRPDLVVIYRKIDNELQLARLGSHSALRL